MYQSCKLGIILDLEDHRGPTNPFLGPCLADEQSQAGAVGYANSSLMCAFE